MRSVSTKLERGRIFKPDAAQERPRRPRQAQLTQGGLDRADGPERAALGRIVDETTGYFNDLMIRSLGPPPNGVTPCFEERDRPRHRATLGSCNQCPGEGQPGFAQISTPDRSAPSGPTRRSGPSSI